MLVCTAVFLPWALPRETISGLLGRWILEGKHRYFAVPAAWFVNHLYFWESNHCVEVALVELEARKALYP